MIGLVDAQFICVLLICLPMETFCCCASLEVGAQIISIVVTLLSTMIAVLYGAAALYLKLSELKTIVYSAMACAGALQFVCGILLCYGAFRYRPKLMYPWLWVSGLSGLCLLSLSVGGYVWTIIEGGPLTVNANLTISAYVIYSLFLLYCWCVVKSRRSQMVAEQEKSESEKMLMGYPTPFKYA